MEQRPVPTAFPESRTPMTHIAGRYRWAARQGGRAGRILTGRPAGRPDAARASGRVADIPPERHRMERRPVPTASPDSRTPSPHAAGRSAVLQPGCRTTALADRPLPEHPGGWPTFRPSATGWSAGPFGQRPRAVARRRPHSTGRSAVLQPGCRAALAGGGAALADVRHGRCGVEGRSVPVASPDGHTLLMAQQADRWWPGPAAGLCWQDPGGPPAGRPDADRRARRVADIPCGPRDGVQVLSGCVAQVAARR